LRCSPQTLSRSLSLYAARYPTRPVLWLIGACASDSADQFGQR
jgi:hypothetical protein